MSTIKANTGIFQNIVLSVGSAANTFLSNLEGFTNGSILYVSGSGSTLSQDNGNFFWDSTNKRLGIKTNSPSTDLHALSSGSSGTDHGITNENISANTVGGNFAGKKSRFALSVPSAISSGDRLVSFNGFGFGTTTYNSVPDASIIMTAAQAFTDAAHGTSIDFWTTPLGSTTERKVVSIGPAAGLILFDSAGSKTVTISRPTTGSSSYNFTLPGSDGTSGQFLQTDGSGNLSFTTVSGGSLPSMSGNANLFLTNDGTIASWNQTLSSDLSTVGTGNHTGLRLTGGFTTKPTKFVLTNNDSVTDWALVAFDTAHGPSQPNGAFALTLEGNGQAFWTDNTLVFNTPSGLVVEGGTLEVTGGEIKFVSPTTPVAGYVWTALDPSGSGDWAPASVTIAPLANDVYLQGRNAANTTDLDIVRINSSDNIELGHPASLEGIEIQNNMINIWGSHTANAGEVWINSHITRLYNPPSSTTAPNLLFGNTAGTFGVSIKADDSLPADLTLTLPADNGTSGYVLSTDGAGILSWIPGAGSFALQDLSNLTATAINADLIFDSAVAGLIKSSDSAIADTLDMNVRSGDATAADFNTGSVNVVSGTATGTGNSGQVNIESGEAENGETGTIGFLTGGSNGTGNTGGIYIQSGTTSSGLSGGFFWKTGDSLGSGNTGTISLASGDATSGLSGDVSLLSGIASGAGASGNVTVASGGSSTAVTGNVLIASGDIAFGSATSGTLTLTSGTANGSSGQVNLLSGLTGSGGSGLIQIATGTSSGAISGGVLITSGQSDIETGQVQMTSGGTLADDVNSGDAAIRTGATSGTGQTGHIRLTTGSGVPSTATSGSIILTTGDATTRGSISLNAPVVQTFDTHLRTFQTDAPVATVDANAGTGATSAVANATDIAGIINLTTTATAPAAGIQTSIAFDQPFATAPIVVITARNADTANFAVASGVYVTTTTTTMEINFATADAIGHAYSWFYHVIETQ